MSSELIKRIETLLQQVDDEKQLLQNLNELTAEENSKRITLNQSKSISELIKDTSILDPDCSSKLIQTGFIGVDILCNGFMLAEMVVIGGRPSMGVDLFLRQMSLNISQLIPTLFISLDTNRSKFTTALISISSGINYGELLRNNYKTSDKQIIEEAIKDISKHKLWVNDDVNYNIADFRMLCEKHVQEDKVQVIFFDCLHLIRPGFRSRYKREVEVSFISSELKKIAKDLNVCIIVGSNLNRSSEYRSGLEGKRPVLSDLRDSGSIEQDADKVFLLHRPEYYHISEDFEGNSLLKVVEVLLVKNDYGALGEVKLKLIDTNSRYEDCIVLTDKKLQFPIERLNEIKPPF